MPSTLRELKADSMRLRLTIRLLTLAAVELRSDNKAEYESLLKEALGTFRSIHAISQIGNGNVSTTPDTTQAPLINSGMLQDGGLDHGSSPPNFSDLPDEN